MEPMLDDYGMPSVNPHKFLVKILALYLHEITWRFLRVISFGFLLQRIF